MSNGLRMDPLTIGDRFQPSIVLTMHPFFFNNGEINLKCASLAFFILTENVAVMVFYNVIYYRQSQAGSVAGFFCGVKRFKNMSERVTIDADSGI